jgi:hypothetical protein
MQALTVFITESGAGYAPFVAQTCDVLLGLLEYNANKDIRTATALAIPALCTSLKKAETAYEPLKQVCLKFSSIIFKAAESEPKASVKVTQLAAVKDIVETGGS